MVNNFKKLNFSEKIHLIIGTGFFSGYSKYFSGTVGTAAAIPFAVLLNKLFSPFIFGTLLFLFTCYSCFIAYDLERIFNEKDSGKIVIDEWIGFFITVFGLPVTFKIYFLGFILFRLFDIVKPFPINYLDKNITNGIGVILDDVVAGIFSFIILKIFLVFG